MRCEVVAIGTELLLGQIIDTNSSWLGEKLSDIGIDSYFQTKVGDNKERIIETIELALSRSDAVICCGGLGPTQDDITRDCIATVTNKPLRKNKSLEKKIKKMFESRGRTMPANNLLQAMVPEGSFAIEDQPGTAPGLICPVGGKVIYALPGVPNELKQMMLSTVLPDLAQRNNSGTIIKSRVIKTWGFTESRLAELLDDKIKKLDLAGNTTLAFLASGIEGLKVRITAKARSEAIVEGLLRKEEDSVRQILGNCIFGVDDETIETSVLKQLRKKKKTVAIAELTSGGLAAHRLLNRNPEGDIFLGAIVPTSPKSLAILFKNKEKLSGDETSAKKLAETVKEKFQADIGLAITGKHDVDDKSKGETYLAIATSNKVIVDKLMLPGDRIRTAQYSVITIFNNLRLYLENLTTKE